MAGSKLSKQEIAKLKKLRREGHPVADIAAQFGVDKTTVYVHTADPRRNRAKQKEIAKRRDRCRELRSQGLSQKEIAIELGVSPSSVSDYLKNEPRMRVMQSGVIPTRTPVIVDLPPAYHRSVTLSLLISVERELRELNAEHCFAGDLADARESGDTVWLRNAEIALEHVQAYLNRLYAVLGDDQVRLGQADLRDDVAQIAKYRNRAKGVQRNLDGRRWTDEELAVVMRKDISPERIAQILGRSLNAVHRARTRERRIQQQAGAGT